MKNIKVADLEKLHEYKEITNIIKETVEEDQRSSICLNNYSLRTLAGYTQDSTDENFNQYVKDYMDKLLYDEHNAKVEEAKKDNDKERLQQLSNEIMRMAGYMQSDSADINQYARSFVDRTLLDRLYNKLYKAIEKDNQQEIDEVYKKIYSMTSYSDERPYGVINEYAQTFVDNRIDTFIQKGIHIPKDIAQEREYAI